MAGTVKLTAIQVQQPIGEFYVTTISAGLLKNLASADMRRITDRDVEDMTGIQRKLSGARRTEIGQYIETVDASFPNSIILSIRSSKIKAISNIAADPCGNGNKIFCIEIESTEDAFQIIDGQHRLAGFSVANIDRFDLIVAFFVDLPVEDQAYLFSTINVTQTKVNKSHVYDLFDVSETRSPQKTAHITAKALNADPKSPFFKRLKLLGVAPTFDGDVLYKAPLSQGMVVDRLLRLITRDGMSDRDAEKRKKKIELFGNEISDGLIFRPFYAEQQDWAILRVMKNFFDAVKDAFPAEWADLENPLAKSIGYGALMRLLVDLYQQGARNNDVGQEFLRGRLADTARAYHQSGRQINFQEFPAAGSGEAKLYRQLAAWSQGLTEHIN